MVERTDKLFASLARSFDATLNFATWDDDVALLGCLRDGALGHATTVAPNVGELRPAWLAARCAEDDVAKEESPARATEGHQQLRMDPLQGGQDSTG